MQQDSGNHFVRRNQTHALRHKWAINELDFMSVKNKTIDETDISIINHSNRKYKNGLFIQTDNIVYYYVCKHSCGRTEWIENRYRYVENLR